MVHPHHTHPSTASALLRALALPAFASAITDIPWRFFAFKRHAFHVGRLSLYACSRSIPHAQCTFWWIRVYASTSQFMFFVYILYSCISVYRLTATQLTRQMQMHIYLPIHVLHARVSWMYVYACTYVLMGVCTHGVEKGRTDQHRQNLAQHSGCWTLRWPSNACTFSSFCQ